jgi:RimJ/RimL family protein N-acetyltransferase
MHFYRLSILGFLMTVSTAFSSVPITFKPLTAGDLPLLFTWFNQPYIEQLWKEPKEWPVFEKKYQKKLQEETTFRFIAFLDDQPFAYIHYYYVNDNDRANFPGIPLPGLVTGMDLFIAKPELLGKGLGMRLIREFIQFIKHREPECRSIIIDLSPENQRAINCYQKIGFVPLGLFQVPYGPKGDSPGPILLLRYDY